MATRHKTQIFWSDLNIGDRGQKNIFHTDHGFCLFFVRVDILSTSKLKIIDFRPRFFRKNMANNTFD